MLLTQKYSFGTVSCTKRGTTPYLEEEDGTHITNATLKSIRCRCRAAWAELVVKKLAPPTWARLCASGQTLMQNVMEKEFPLFWLDADGWKLTLLCTTDYPNWWKCHLDQDGSWKNPDKTAAKHEAMGDDDGDGMHSDTKPIRAPVFKSNGEKRERTDDSVALELTDKRQKVSLAPSLPEHDPGSPVNISDSDVSRDCNHSPIGGLGNISDNQHKPDLPLPALPPSSPPRHGAFLPGIPLDDSNKENVPVILKNPL
ncbi:hypothetical protein DFH29DRAFT_882114, partial [Suillus ampliporus]